MLFEKLNVLNNFLSINIRNIRTLISVSKIDTESLRLFFLKNNMIFLSKEDGFIP